MKIRFYTTVIYILSFVTMYGQRGKDNYFPPSPEAGSLIKAIDIPVNYSTGVSSYSIPIYTIVLKDLSIPITLNYKSSGFKPSEIASDVGLGWDLNVGGQITQNVIGRNDLFSANVFNKLPNDRDLKLPLEGTEYSNFLNSPYDLDSLHQNTTDYMLIKNAEQNQIDTQPDIFYYSNPNKSGKFFFTNNFETKQIPFGKEIIAFSSQNNEFKITDTNGVIYIYSTFSTIHNTTTSTSTIDHFNGVSYSESRNYYLDKIITPSNQIVDFYYDDITYDLINNIESTRYHNSFSGGMEKLTTYQSRNYSKQISKILVKDLSATIYEVNFKKLKYRKDLAGLNSVVSPKTIDAIEIKNNQNTILTYNFDYGYFGRSANDYNSNIFEPNLNQYILKLKNLTSSKNDNYTFNYYNETLTERFTDCLDDWGYYNSACIKYTYNPLFSTGPNTLIRKPSDLERTKTNILSSIILPTKGEILFNYELNTTSSYLINSTTFNQDQVAGVYSNEDDDFSYQHEIHQRQFTVPQNVIGDPIFSADFSNGNGGNTTDNIYQLYFYDNNNNIINFQLIDNGMTKKYSGPQLIPGQNYTLVLECKDNPGNQNYYATISFNSKIDLSTVSTDPIGGLRIKEIILKENDNKIIKRYDYNLDNESSGILYDTPSYFDYYSYFKEGDMATTPNVGLNSFSVQYSKMPSNLFGFNGYHVYYKKVTESKIDILNPAQQIKKEILFTFTDDLRYGDKTYFSKISYDWKRGLEKENIDFVGGSAIRKTIYDYTFLDTTSSFKPSIETGNHLDLPIYPNEYHQRSIDYSRWRGFAGLPLYYIYKYTSSKLISSWYYLNKKTVEEYLNGKTLKTETSYAYNNPTNAQLSKSTTQFPDGNIQETTYQYAHEKGNSYLIGKNMVSIPLQTTVKKTANGSVKTISDIQTDYPVSQADANNRTSGLPVPYQVVSKDLQGASNTEVEYTKYDPSNGNLQEYKIKGLTPVAIIWGYNNAQPIAKVEGATYAQALAAVGSIVSLSDADAQAGKNNDETPLLTALDSFRNNTALVNFQVSTYTYDPLIGVRTITPPSGIREYYLYDTANRLEKVVNVKGDILKEYQYHYKN